MLDLMWFETEKSDLSYVERSPFQLATEIIVFAPPERVFDVLAGESFHEWLKELVECRWTSAPPHRVGSTREVVLDLMPGARGLPRLAVKERFLAWERGKRLTFSIDASTLPLVKQMVEDMQLEPIGDAQSSRMGPRAKTRLRYTVHYTPGVAMRAIHPVSRVIFGKLFRDAARRVAMVAARGQTKAEVPVEKTAAV